MTYLCIVIKKNNIMKTLLNRKQLLSDLFKLHSAEAIWLTIYQKGIEVCCKMLTFDAIKLVQMLPYKTTTYYYEKVSDLA